MERKRSQSPGRAKSPGRPTPTSARAKSPGRGKSNGREEKRVPTKKQRRYQQHHLTGSDDEDDESVMPAVLQRKIMAQARLQQDEVEGQERQRGNISAGARKPVSAVRGDEDDDDDDDEDDGAGDADDGDDDAELAEAGEYYEDVEELNLGEDDERALDLLMGGGKTRTLADVIMGKINERNAALAGGGDAVAQEPEESAALPPKVVEVYTSVGKFLSTYKSGKLPKAFKIVPRLANWEEVLYTTDPDGWTPAATCEATRLFASNLNPKMAQRYFNLVLLPAVQVSGSDWWLLRQRQMAAPPCHARPLRLITLSCMHPALPHPALHACSPARMHSTGGSLSEGRVLL